MIVNNWLERFWHMIGQFFGKMRYEFNSVTLPQGVSITEVPLTFTPEQVWFTCHNPRHEDSDWSRINLVRVLSVNDGVNIIAEVKSDECKVSWFTHA